jgi:starch phosphorylase
MAVIQRGVSSSQEAEQRETEALRQSLLENLRHIAGKIPETSTRHDWYLALAHTVRDRLLDRWTAWFQQFLREKRRAVSYLSAEFLLGPHLANNLTCLGISEQARRAVESLGLSLDDLLEQEEEPGLGNGGLGRLAACFPDSLATLEVPAIGYGIRYEFGIFDQEIHDGWQVEVTDKWLRLGNPWEIARPEVAHKVPLGGHTEHWVDDEGRFRARWLPARVIRGIAHDTPILGCGVESVALLRLWRAEAVESFDFDAFNVGDYYRAVEEKVVSENLSKILYPNDEPLQGRQLRLEQQFFFVSCSLQNMLQVHLARGLPIETFHESFAIQLNDTHPAIAVAELMRLLVDEQGMEWEPAWEVTRAAVAYTNHTLLPEALERWPLPLFTSVLPRPLEIIYEINRRFLAEVRAARPEDPHLPARLSLIDERGDRHVRMAHLATAGSHAVNGVARLHTELLKRDVLADFHSLWPERFHSVTNGVTPRRWIAVSNPRLARLISARIGDGWLRRFETQIGALEAHAEDPEFREAWRAVKRACKEDLARLVAERTGIQIDPASLFDVLVKRIHEYKRQHLDVLHIITLCNRLRRDPGLDLTPHTFLFGGKAAPGHAMAKLMIKLINSVGEVVNADPAVAGRLRVAFIPDFNVKTAQHIYPAADLSEQISTAGEEASGTGNMKFSMNGALTIGTLDGANVEIRDAVGAENFFLFGLNVEEVHQTRARGYDPRAICEGNPALREAIDQIASGVFSRGDKALFRPLVDSLLNHDEYLLFADYQSYVDCQDRVGKAFRDEELWSRTSILNVARMGAFSSDRSIRDYGRLIWDVPVPEGNR